MTLLPLLKITVWKVKGSCCNVAEWL